MRDSLRFSAAVLALGLCTSANVPAALSAPSHGGEFQGPAPGQEAETPAPPTPIVRPARLTQTQTQLRLGQYKRAENWALRGLVLLSLGRDWHPSGQAIVLDALRSDVPELRVYGLEALARTNPFALRRVLSSEIIDLLVDKFLRNKDPFHRGRVLSILRTAFPEAEVSDYIGWRRFWFDCDESYTPDPWAAPIVHYDGRSVATKGFARAMDLYESGLEVVICIDSTGSMQSTISATARAIDDIVSLLEAIAPDFRLGLVHYRELGDLKNGAAILSTLSKRADNVRDRLKSMKADGGGDFPERVERGLERALDVGKMKWRRESAKLILVVGDAPPHENTVVDCIRAVKAAYERPFDTAATKIRATLRDGKSRAAPTRPFVTACLGVGTTGVNAETRATFRLIADAGGGAYAELLTNNPEAGKSASDAIVAQVLKLSFGAQYEEHMDAFVEIFLDYQRRGLLK